MPFCQDILLTELRWATFSHEGHTINAYFGPQKKRDKGMDCLKSSSETSYRAALYSRHLFSEPAQDKKQYFLRSVFMTVSLTGANT